MSIRRATGPDIILLGATMMVWALAFIGMKVAVPEVGPYWVATARAVFGLLTVLPFAFWMGFSWPKGVRQWRLMLTVTMFNIVIPITLIAWCMKTLDAGVSALLMGTGPFMALFLGHFMTQDERFNVPRVIAAFLGFAGVASIVGVDAFNEAGQGNFLPQIVILFASLMYVFAGFTVKKVEVPPVSLAIQTMLFGSIALMPLSLFISGPLPTDISGKAMGWLAFTGILGTGGGVLVRYYLIRKVGYSFFSVGVNLIPVFGLILGAIILGEVITLSTIFALILILAGLFIARLATRPPASSA